MKKKEHARTRFGVKRFPGLANRPSDWFSVCIYKHKFGFGPDGGTHFAIYLGWFELHFGQYMTDYGFQKWFEELEICEEILEDEI